MELEDYMGNIAIIPARGGSKRIPKKNIKEFLGRPIISYAIEAALESGVFEEVMVSTDSEEIAEIAKRYGAKVPFLRSEKTASDFATTDDVLLEVLSEYEKRGKTFEYMACIYATAPFVTGVSLKKAVDILEKEKTTMVMPLAAFSYPPQRSYTIDEKGIATFREPKYLNSRSQDLEKWYHEVGQYYLFDVKKYVSLKGQIEEDISALIVDDIEAQDIDTEDDWKIAELKYKLIHNM